MSTIFCSNETVSLEREIEYSNKEILITNIWNENELERCLTWISINKFDKICLQFPDDLLVYSTQITSDITSKCNVDIFVLGDTSYGSCCVDTVAAAHVNAKGIIHFGHACLSKIAQIPVLYIFMKFEFDEELFIKSLNAHITDKNAQIIIFYDIGFYHKVFKISTLCDVYPNIVIAKLAIDQTPDMLCWLSTGSNTLESFCVYLGKDNQSFFNLSISIKCKQWILYDEQKHQLKEISPLKTNWMKKRYFFIEKCKDAQTIGIVVGTLSTDGYLNIVKHIQDLTKKHQIRSYIISVGKVNPAKLANFIDIDCFVLVGCPENTIYNSREFFKPLISVFELEMALNPAWHLQLPDSYCTDFKEILPNGKLYRNANNLKIIENDVSLVTGKIRNKEQIEFQNPDNCTELVEKSRNEVSSISSSDAFNERSWKGLDPMLGQHNASGIELGRSGLPLNYSENPEV